MKELINCFRFSPRIGWDGPPIEWVVSMKLRSDGAWNGPGTLEIVAVPDDELIKALRINEVTSLTAGLYTRGEQGLRPRATLVFLGVIPSNATMETNLDAAESGFMKLTIKLRYTKFDFIFDATVLDAVVADEA